MKARQVLGIGCVTLLVLLAALFGLVASSKDARLVWRNRDLLTSGGGTAESARVKTFEGVVEMMGAHPERVSIAAWEVGAADAGLFHRADQPRFISSASKLVVASALAQAFATGGRSPGATVPRERVDRLHLPGTDGDGHPQAMAELPGADQLTLAQLGFAMLRFNDHAAADALMLELGRPALDAEVQRLALPGLAAPAPFSGHLLALLEDRAPARSPDPDRAWKVAAALAGDEAAARRARLLLEEEGLPALSQISKHHLQSTHRGTARAYAALIERVATEAGPWGDALRGWLDWPMSYDYIHEAFERFGRVGGVAVPSTASVTFAAPRDAGVTTVSAVFFDELPLWTWRGLFSSSSQEDVELWLASGRAAHAELRARLLAPAPGADGGVDVEVDGG